MTEFFQKYGFIPVIQPLPAVFGVVADTQKTQFAHFFKQFFERCGPLFLPFIHIGIDFLVYKIPHRPPDHVVIFVKIDILSCLYTAAHGLPFPFENPLVVSDIY